MKYCKNQRYNVTALNLEFFFCKIRDGQNFSERTKYENKQNFSRKGRCSEKTIWILPERTATRTIGQLLNFWEVVIFEGGEYKTCVPHKNLIGEFAQGLRHEWEVSELFLDYEFQIKAFTIVAPFVFK